MELSNTTGQDTKYKVTSGGSGMAPHGNPFRIEEAVGWPTLHAGGRIHHQPKSSGPWLVYFVVKGQGISVATSSPDDRVSLVESNGGFRAQVS